MIIAEGRLRLRWFHPGDVPQLVDLHLACYRQEHWGGGDFQRFVDNAGRNNVVKVLAGDDGTVYGSLLYTVRAGDIRVRRVAVWPDYRRRGLGTFMVHVLTGRRSPVRQPLVTAKGGPAADPFLLALGFAPGDGGVLTFDRAASAV